MTVDKMLEVQEMGDQKGSALKELAEYFGCEDYDLSPISDAMVDIWIERKERERHDA